MDRGLLAALVGSLVLPDCAAFQADFPAALAIVRPLSPLKPLHLQPLCVLGGRRRTELGLMMDSDILEYREHDQFTQYQNKYGSREWLHSLLTWPRSYVLKRVRKNGSV